MIWIFNKKFIFFEIYLCKFLLFEFFASFFSMVSSIRQSAQTTVQITSIHTKFLIVPRSASFSTENTANNTIQVLLICCTKFQHFALSDLLQAFNKTSWYYRFVAYVWPSEHAVVSCVHNWLLYMIWQHSSQHFISRRHIRCVTNSRSYSLDDEQAHTFAV